MGKLLEKIWIQGFESMDEADYRVCTSLFFVCLYFVLPSPEECSESLINSVVSCDAFEKELLN